MSILIQLHRIFGISRGMYYATLIGMAVVMAYGIESVTTGIFTCTPIRAYWDLTIQPTARCLPEYKYAQLVNFHRFQPSRSSDEVMDCVVTDDCRVYYANGGLNIMTDLAIATLPIYSVWKLQMNLRQKIALIAILALGWL